MASAMPDLQLPSLLMLVPNLYCLVTVETEKHETIGELNLLFCWCEQVVTAVDMEVRLVDMERVVVVTLAINVFDA